ncbi:MAG: glutamate 5-kinase [Oscillospiraceae bacterium]|nr:glutamate 5-kinase [Oscillospiraceae bacterium]
MKNISDARRIVIKIGSSTLTHETGRINIRRFELLCKVLSDIKNSGREIIVVSSGAVAVGLGKLGLHERPTDTPGKQAVAAVGQCELMYLYDQAFMERNHKVGQILLTRDCIEDPHRLQNIKNTFSTLLKLDAIPVVNENDSVSVEELEFGDNDTLSAQVAVVTEADALIMLSDIEGLYNCDPNKNPDAKLIPVVERIDESIEKIAGGAGSNRGTGGMQTKISAARIAGKHGICTAIINGTRPELLYDLLDGREAGTVFIPEEK